MWVVMERRSTQAILRPCGDGLAGTAGIRCSHSCWPGERSGPACQWPLSELGQQGQFCTHDPTASSEMTLECARSVANAAPNDLKRDRRSALSPRCAALQRQSS